MQLHWTVSVRASCLHAAEALAHGQLVVDSALAEAITEPAQELRKAINAASLPRTQFWRNLVGLSVMVDGLSELAERAVTKTVGTPRAASIARNLVASIAGIESAVRRAFPNLLDELSPRLLPWREQWEVHGPLLLQGVARWTDPRAVVSEAQVVLVYPALGGGGAAHLPFNNVHIEAVLTNPVPELPENLRLAWLLAQLGLDLPAFSDQILGPRLPDVAALAMVPVTLQAAQDAQLLELHPDTVDRALTAWQILTPTDVDPVDVLWRWWSTYLDTRPRWDIALTALDRMLG
jgi:hypothetical protein